MSNQPLQIISVIVVLRCEEKFLLVQRAKEDEIFPGKWQNVGGKVELGEKIENAIGRELKEEVGMQVGERPIFLMSYSWKKDQGGPVRLGTIFLMDLGGSIKNHKINISEELADFGWFNIKEIESMNNDDELIGKDSPTGTLKQIIRVDS